ncbi:MAG: response regulator transcription factor [Deltaproteobacteria bacterium]|nr:response regulator transcription factor [Candidatus Desulfobacula maris]
MIKILIVDDHYLIREGLIKILETENDLCIVGELQKGSDVCDFIKRHECDLIILDINLPDRNGLDVLKDVKAVNPDILILMLSVLPEDQFAVRALRAGASGYITKEGIPEELIKAIRKVVTGRRYVSEQFAEKLAMDLSSPSKQNLHDDLSDREFQILLLIGSGLSGKEIARNLSLSTSTVNTYRARIYEKMNMKTITQLIHYVANNDLLK